MHLRGNDATAFQHHLGEYLRQCYVSRAVLHAALERSIVEHDLGIRLDTHLPKLKHIRNMAFGEALTLLYFREAGFWAPLDKLGLDPNPESTTKGIDILAFRFADSEDAEQPDCMYVFEVKTTGDRGYVKRSISKEGGIVELFNDKLIERGMINDEINWIIKEVEKQDGQSSYVSRLVALYETPLQQRKKHERYCPSFVLDSRLEVDDHLALLEQIDHPCTHKLLYLIRVDDLSNVISSTFDEAATLDQTLDGRAS